MFWKFTPHLTQLDTILDNEDVTLMQVLDEDYVLQECKMQNRKLIAFLTKSEHMNSLVDLIITEPLTDSGDDVKYKFPNTACELLTADVDEINDLLVGNSTGNPLEDDHYLNRLYSFIEMAPPLNPLLASFFVKVMTSLAARKSDKVIQFLKRKENFLDRIMEHLGTSAIMDFLLRLVQQCDSEESRANIAQWFNSERLIHRIVEGLLPSESEAKHAYTGHCLSELITIYREQLAQAQDSVMTITPDTTCLLDTAESSEILGALVNHMLAETPKMSVIVNCLYVFQTIMDRKKSENPLAELNPLLLNPPIDPARVVKATDALVQVLLPRLAELHAILHNPPKQEYSVMETTVGILLPPLGNSRLQIVNLIQTLVAVNSPALNTAICQERILNTLLELFSQYPWNTFLHKHVEDTVCNILETVPGVPSTLDHCPLDMVSGSGFLGSSEEDSEAMEPGCLQRQLLVDCDLIEKIITLFKENDQLQSVARGRRKGYMGHLTRIANCLNDNLKCGPNARLLQQYYQELDPNLISEWETFVTKTLMQVNEVNRIEMPILGLNCSDEDDFRGIVFPTGSNSFGQQYGFAEEVVDTNKISEFFSHKMPHNLDLGMGGEGSDRDVFTNSGIDLSGGASDFRLTLSGLRGRRNSSEDPAPPPVPEEEEDDEEDMWVERQLTLPSEGSLVVQDGHVTRLPGVASFGDEDNQEMPARATHPTTNPYDTDSDEEEEEDLPSAVRIRSANVSDRYLVVGKDAPPVAMQTTSEATSVSTISTKNTAGAHVDMESNAPDWNLKSAMSVYLNYWHTRFEDMQHADDPTTKPPDYASLPLSPHTPQPTLLSDNTTAACMEISPESVLRPTQKIITDSGSPVPQSSHGNGNTASLPDSEGQSSWTLLNSPLFSPSSINHQHTADSSPVKPGVCSDDVNTCSSTSNHCSSSQSSHQLEEEDSSHLNTSSSSRHEEDNTTLTQEEDMDVSDSEPHLQGSSGWITPERSAGLSTVPPETSTAVLTSITAGGMFPASWHGTEMNHMVGSQRYDTHGQPDTSSTFSCPAGLVFPQLDTPLSSHSTPSAQSQKPIATGDGSLTSSSMPPSELHNDSGKSCPSSDLSQTFQNGPMESEKI